MAGRVAGQWPQSCLSLIRTCCTTSIALPANSRGTASMWQLAQARREPRRWMGAPQGREGGTHTWCAASTLGYGSSTSGGPPSSWSTSVRRAHSSSHRTPCMRYGFGILRTVHPLTDVMSCGAARVEIGGPGGEEWVEGLPVAGAGTGSHTATCAHVMQCTFHGVPPLSPVHVRRTGFGDGCAAFRRPLRTILTCRSVA